MQQACLQRHLRKFGEFIGSEIPAYCRYSVTYYQKVKGRKNKLEIRHLTYYGVDKFVTHKCYQIFCLFVCFVTKCKNMPAHLNSPFLLCRRAGNKGMGSLLLLVADVPVFSYDILGHTAGYIGGMWAYEN